MADNNKLITFETYKQSILDALNAVSSKECNFSIVEKGPHVKSFDLVFKGYGLEITIESRRFDKQFDSCAPESGVRYYQRDVYWSCNDIKKILLAKISGIIFP